MEAVEQAQQTKKLRLIAEGCIDRLADIPERNDACPGSGERHDCLCPVLLVDLSADPRQSRVRGLDRVLVGSAGGGIAARPGPIGVAAVLGELAVGLVYGLSLALLNEMLLFAGQIVGLQFSFSLVNLLDPDSAIQTPLLGDLFQLMGTLVVITAGLDRILLASLVRSFRVVPLGGYAFGVAPAAALVRARRGGVFLAALELAAPVLAATMLMEVAVALLGKLSPQLPVMFLTVPLKTLTGFAILAGCLALWPRFIEARFAGLLDMAERLIALPGDAPAGWRS